MKRVAFWFALLAPFGFLAYMLFLQGVNDPIAYIFSITGYTSIVILFLTLLISRVRSFYNLIKYRRLVGMFGFFYAFLHVANFLVLDQQLDVASFLKESFDKQYIFLGMGGFLIVLFMAITSTKKLFKRFRKQHQGIYLALVLILVHYVLSQKVITFYEYGFVAAFTALLFWRYKDLFATSSTS